MSASPCLPCSELPLFNTGVPLETGSAGFWTPKGLLTLRTQRNSAKRGFSLVEVSLAISIIAIAFITLLGLLPVGMGIFRESRDASNENWIFQVIQAKVQATDWTKLMPNAVPGSTGDSVYAGDNYYYDAEGRLLKQEGNSPFETPNWEFNQMYKVKILNGPIWRPEDLGGGKNAVQDASVFAVLLVNITDKRALTAFEAIKQMDKGIKPLPKGIRLRTFVVTKMDSAL